MTQKVGTIEPGAGNDKSNTPAKAGDLGASLSATGGPAGANAVISFSHEALNDLDVVSRGGTPNLRSVRLRPGLQAGMASGGVINATNGVYTSGRLAGMYTGGVYTSGSDE